MDKTTRNLTIAWLGGIPIGIFNGIARTNLYGPYINELLAHQISTLTALALFAAYFWILNKQLVMTSTRQALFVGLNWLVLTVIFEFLFGHYIVGHSWGYLLHDYNVFAGRLWILVLLWMFIGPYVIFRVTKKKTEHRVLNL